MKRNLLLKKQSVKHNKWLMHIMQKQSGKQTPENNNP